MFTAAHLVLFVRAVERAELPLARYFQRWGGITVQQLARAQHSGNTLLHWLFTHIPNNPEVVRYLRRELGLQRKSARLYKDQLLKSLARHNNADLLLCYLEEFGGGAD